MSDPSYSLQKAVFARLNDAASALQTSDLAPVPVFDNAPANQEGLYLVFGDDQTLDDSADCIIGSLTTITLDGWDTDGTEFGYGRLKKMSAALRTDLDRKDLALDGHRLVSLEFEEARYLRDPDGVSRHAVWTFTARTEPL